MTNTHHRNPEFWFGPIQSPVLPSEVLFELFKEEKLIATPRLGKRDGTHPKGYVPGTVATVRLYNNQKCELLNRRVRILGVVSRPLCEFGGAELEEAHYPPDWQSLQQDLSLFEGRPVARDELVSIVTFSYLKEEA